MTMEESLISTAAESTDPGQATAASDIGPGKGVSVSGLSKTYGTNLVLDDVSFQVPEGGVYTLLGSSGSGKTTTLRVLAGLERPDAGDIHIGGKLMASKRKITPAEDRGIGLVFQSYALWPHMRTFDQIAYPLRVRRVKKAEIHAAVTKIAEAVGLETLLARYPSELSGGQQQRVALARALVFNPRLLLLDEPLSNLDAALRRQTRMELQRIQREFNVTTVWVTHDQEEAMAVSDKVVVMSKGKVLTVGTPRDLFDHPTSAFVASFVGASNTLLATVESIEGEHATVKLVDGGGLLRGRTPHQLKAGDKVVVAIKPIDITLRTNGPDHGNGLSGTVLATTYVGAQIELEIQVGGRKFSIPVERWDAHRPGDQVELLVHPDRVSVLDVSAE
jgi:iron(III) transport system ATP-binding protein